MASSLPAERGYGYHPECQSLAQTQQNASALHHAQEQVDPGEDMEFEITGPEGGTIIQVVGSVNEKRDSQESITRCTRKRYEPSRLKSGAGVRASKVQCGFVRCPGYISQEGKPAALRSAEPQGRIRY